VVKEEKRLRVDNQPYGNFLAEVKKEYFKTPLSLGNYWFYEPSRRRDLRGIQAFNKKFYIPNNAVLIVAVISK
jgi:predicted Zn-dependent peptidase